MIASERLVFLSVPPKWRVVAIFTLTVIFFLPTHGAAQTNWPMPGHDAQHAGRANFAGPISAPTAPSWTFSTVAPIVGDVVTSTEGTLYFASDQLYALKPDGTPFAPSVSIGIPATGPVVDDSSGLIYIAVAASDGGFDLLKLTKQLQSTTVVLHIPRPANGAIISPLVVGRGGLVFFVAGRFPGVVYAAGPVQWSNPACPAEAGPNTPFGASANSPVVSTDGSSLFVMCGGGTGGQDGLVRLQAGTGATTTPTPTNRNSTEPVLDSLQHIRSGWQAFGGAVFCGDYLAWDFSLTLLTTPAAACDSSRFTTSRAAIMPDGQSTVRIGFAFPPNNQLDAEGINNWIISTDGSTVPNFTSLPSVDAAGNVFIGNTQGIEALSPIDGHALWSFTTGDQITTQPVIANGGALYVGSSSGKVYAFNTTPAHQSGTVYVSGSGAGFATVNLLSASVTATNNTFTDGGVIAVSPNGTRSYVSAIFGLAVVDNTTNQVITTVSVGSRPAWVALSPDGSRVYVSQPNIGSAPGVLQGVYVIDTVTNAIIASIPIPGPQRVAVAPDNSRVYVGSGGRGIIVLDPITNTVVRSVDILGAQTTGIAFTPDGAHAYVGEINGPSVYLIDARADALLQTIPLSGSLGGGVSGIIASPDGSKVYAGNVRNGPFVTAPRDVFVIDTVTNAVSGQIPVSFPSPQFAISSDGANLLVGDSDMGSLTVASLATDSVVESIHVNDPCCPNITGIGAKLPTAVSSSPQLSAPSLVDFGTIVLGTQSSRNIKLVNAGNAPVSITALATNDPNFVLMNAPLTQIVIAPGTFTEVSLNFVPGTRGALSGELSIVVLGLPLPLKVSLRGNAILPPFLKLLPPMLDFGKVSIAETKQLQVQIQNTGEAPLVGSVFLQPSDAFTISGSSDFFILGGQSAFFSVSFAPRARSQFAALISVTSNARDANIPISGVGERVAVVLVHGFNSDPSATFGELEPLLRVIANLDVFTFDYSADTQLTHGLPIERIAAKLSSFIANLIVTQGIDRVDIVAHSMGGLVTRAYIADMAVENGRLVPYADNIRKLITIGTPNYGVPPRVLTNLDSLANREVQEMLFSSSFILQLDKNWGELVANDFVPRIANKDILTIIGTQTPDGSVFPYGIDDDGLVPGPSATLPCLWLSCEGQAVDQHVRYVPYQHSEFDILGVNALGNTPAEALVLDKDFQTFRLVHKFLLEEPLELIFPPPSQFTDNGLLLIRIADADIGKSIRIFDFPLTTVLIDGAPVFINANGTAGALTVWPISAGRHRIDVLLNLFAYPDPAPATIDIRGERPTEVTFLLHRTRLP